MELRNEITPDEKKEVAKIHKVSRQYVDMIVRGSRVNAQIIISCEQIVERRKEMVAQLTKERQAELGRLMQSMASEKIEITESKN